MDASQNLGRLVQVYTAIRDARTAKRHAWEAADLELETDQDKLKVVMLDILNRTGANSIATDSGTAYKQEKVKPSVADWSAFYDWVLEDKERFEAIEKRIKSTFVKEFMDQNEGALPPGVNVIREYEITVRRPSDKSSGNNPSAPQHT